MGSDFKPKKQLSIAGFSKRASIVFEHFAGASFWDVFRPLDKSSLRHILDVEGDHDSRWVQFQGPALDLWRLMRWRIILGIKRQGSQGP